MLQSLDDYFRLEKPRSFTAVLGHERWFESVFRRLSNERATLSYQPIVLIGPPGVGKRTLAKLYAQALICETDLVARVDGAPCGVCDECGAIQSGSFAYFERDVRGVIDDVDVDEAQEEAVRMLIDSDGGLNTTSFRIVVLYNAEYLAPSAADIALKTLEKEVCKTIYIFVANDFDRFSAALRSRCSVYLVGPISTKDLAARLSLICERRSVPFDERALLAIAAEAAGSYRMALENLRRVEVQGDATLGSLLRTPEFGWGATMLECWRAVLAGRRDEAAALFELTNGDGRTRLKAIQGFLVECDRRARGTLSTVTYSNPALACLPEEDWLAILEDWEQWCLARGRSFREIIDPILHFWANVRMGVPSNPSFLKGYNLLYELVESDREGPHTT